MTVVEVWTPAGSAIASGEGYDPAGSVVLSDPQAQAAVTRLARTGVLCSSGYAYQGPEGWRAHGDPMEAAIDVLARRMGIDTDAARGRRSRRSASRSILAGGGCHSSLTPRSW